MNDQSIAETSIVVICRVAEEDAILGALAFAKSARVQGAGATVVFTAECLHALDEGTLRWSHTFADREQRARVISRSGTVGIDIVDRTRDPRWSDIRGTIVSLGNEGEISLVACPLWSKILELSGPPPGLSAVTESEYIELVVGATTVIGEL